jgi:sulfur relay (sulfurtransferase) DsrF/TusC family protein
MMKVTVLLTRPPQSTAHMTEALRVSLMLAALGNSVSLVLIDDGVFVLLEKAGASFGLETLKRAEDTDNLRLYVHGNSFRKFLPNVKIPETYGVLETGDIASMILSEKVLVF